MKLKAIFFFIVLIVLLLIFATKREKSSGSEWIDVKLSMDELKRIQCDVDNGHFPGYLDPENVVYEFACSNHFIIKDKSKVHCKKISNNRELFCSLSLVGGKILETILFKPVRQDSTGIWVVKSYRIKKELFKIPF